MRTTVRSIPPPSPAPARGADALTTAAGIGERLARAAVWYRGRCNWVALDSAANGTVHRALGPDLGAGTAGIALFLAQLAAARENAAIRRTALGAISQALGYAGQVPAHGLYAGRLGIAYAAGRCGRLLGEERLVARAAQLARGRSCAQPARGYDLLAGDAGAIAGLLALARLLGDETLVQRARGLSDDLAAGARRGRAGWSWQPAPGAHRMHGLCGMSRGAAGAAWALLELHATTGEQRHRDCAERALDYERHWFDPCLGEWPDLRGIERREPRGAFQPPFETSWAHGAPGIALARLRAWKICGDERYRAEATTALATTAAHVERELLVPGADFSLAHGLGGSAEVLLLGAELRPEGAVLAQRAAEIAASRHAASLDGWPNATAGAGLAPGLLGGHAGIGLFYLRLHDRAVPSALLIGAPR
jgi:lantibiotic biosynthesis protein